MKKQLTFSLIIPAYNEEHHLAACLDAVAAQTEAPDEVIVVDNNSTDKTAEICKQYSFVKLLKESKQGIAFARDRGFITAQSDIIGRIDADTIVDRDWVERTIKYFQQNPTTAAVSGSCLFYDFPLPRATHMVHWFFYYKLHAWIAGSTILWGSNMALRQSAWQECQKALHYNQDIHEDIDLAINLYKKGLQIDYVPSMRAEVSLRRGSFDLRRDYKYLSMWPKTYIVNSQPIRTTLIEGLKWVIILLLALPVFILSAIHVRRHT